MSFRAQKLPAEAEGKTQTGGDQESPAPVPVAWAWGFLAAAQAKTGCTCLPAKEHVEWSSPRAWKLQGSSGNWHPTAALLS